MTTIAAPTCGFLPLHLYEGQGLDDAFRIVDEINRFALAGMGIGVSASPALLRTLSLQDLLDAVRTVDAWNDRPSTSSLSREISMVPSDRLTAAVYALINFHSPWAFGPDGDVVPVQFTTPSSAGMITHFLLVGARMKQEDDI